MLVIVVCRRKLGPYGLIEKCTKMLRAAAFSSGPELVLAYGLAYNEMELIE